MKQFGQFAVIGLILLSIVMLYDGIFILEEGKQAVITQFGAPVGDPVTEAGAHLKMPFIQHVRYFQKKILVWDGVPNQIPTNDKTYIYLDTTARWRISDALKFLQAVRTEERAQSLLSDIIDGTVRDFVNKNDLIEIIRSSDWSTDTMSASTPLANLGVKPKTGRDKVTAQIREVASKVTPQYGIELIDVMIKRVNYIESVRRKVYDRMISERKRIAAEKRSLGEGEKAKILGTVERTLQEITSKANKEALEIRGKADAEATRIYGAAYSQDPEFYAFQKTIESYETIIGANSHLVLSADSQLYKYLGGAGLEVLNTAGSTPNTTSADNLADSAVKESASSIKALQEKAQSKTVKSDTAVKKEEQAKEADTKHTLDAVNAIIEKAEEGISVKSDKEAENKKTE